MSIWATDADQADATVPGTFTIGSAVGDGVREYTADLLLPLWHWPQGLIFFNPRVSLTDHDGSAEEFNLGLGARKLIGDSLILGANLYFDHRSTENDREYDQFGAGVELLSPWADARLNYYLPENDREITDSFDQVEQRRTSRSWWEDPYASGHGIWQQRRTETITTTITRRYESYEQAMEGWDAEIGVKVPGLPDWLETRLFLGGYRFDAPYGDDVQGWKGRIEVRPVRGLVIDAARYEDEELYGADWLVGARLSVPIDLDNLLAGSNPFQSLKQWFRPGKREFPERLGEMVMRDPQIHTEQWGPLENLEKKRIDVKEELSASRYVLLTDVMFVDAGRSGAWENGTWEYPFDLVQEGVNGAFGEQNVYVNAFADSYRENVALSSGTQLYGSGWLISGHGGKSFGSGIQPIIDGGGNGPVIRLASTNSIRGFHLVNTAPGAPQLEFVGDSFIPFFVENSGIVGSDFNGTTIIEANSITTSGDGLLLAPAGGTVFIGDNIIQAGDHGTLLLIENGVTLDSISIANNSITAGTFAVAVAAANTSVNTISIVGNTLTATGVHPFFPFFSGIYFENLGSLIRADISGNTIVSGNYGVYLNNFSGSITAFTSGPVNIINAQSDAVFESGLPGTIINTIDWEP
ncbi:MAG: inverse autotransporter beta domain-containing protein [Desulfofustis sp.]|nr:inverse autotransporter beta domain-containing protein [Desulfofustis sp.]